MVADVQFGAGGHKTLDRIIGVNLGAPNGILCLPASDDAPDGWGDPREGDELGTPGGADPFNLFNRALGATEVNLLRGRERPFTAVQICDWRGLETEVGKGNMPVLHFHGPFNRYFPVSTGGTIFLEREASALYESFFYVDRGRTQIPSPNGALVRGVGIRDNDGTPEYVIATNDNVYTIGTTEFWVRPISGPVTEWRLLRSFNAFEFGIGEGTATGVLKWRAPLHFNRLGTKCVTAVKGTFTVPAAAGRLHKLEFDVGITDVSFAVEDLTIGKGKAGSRTTFFSQNQTSDIDPPCPPGTIANPCPEIPFCGRAGPPVIPGSSILQTSNVDTTTTWEISEDDNADAMMVAFDYKIDSDSELGSISYGQESTFAKDETRRTISDSEAQVCFFIGGITGPRRVGVVGGVVTSQVSTINTTRRKSGSSTYSMDGGRNSFAIEIDTFTGAQGDIDVTITSSSDTNPVPPVIESSSTWNIGFEAPAEPTLFTGWLSGTFRTEMAAADIRYGSMIIREARDLGQGHTFNMPTDLPPLISNPVSAPPTKNPAPSGPFAGIVPINAALSSAGTIALDWTAGIKLQVTYHIESEATSEKVIVEDELYAPGHILASEPFLLLQKQGLAVFTQAERDDVFPTGAFPTGDVNGIPPILNEPERIAQNGIQQAQAIHDRFGSYFWTVAADPGNFLNLPLIGTSFFFSPDALNIGDADYEFQDPIVVTGIPGDNPRFDPVSLL